MVGREASGQFNHGMRRGQISGAKYTLEVPLSVPLPVPIAEFACLR